MSTRKLVLAIFYFVITKQYLLIDFISYSMKIWNYFDIYNWCINDIIISYAFKLCLLTVRLTFKLLMTLISDPWNYCSAHQAPCHRRQQDQDSRTRCPVRPPRPGPCWHEDWTYRGLHPHPLRCYPQEGRSSWTQAVNLEHPVYLCG